MPIKNQFLFAGGCVAGALGMYYTDPHRGAYRRAILRDKSVHFQKAIVRKTGVAGRDLSHRARGIAATARARFFPERVPPVPNDILVARVASKIGRIVANPHSIGVSAERGRVMLTGPIFNDEVEPLFHVVRRIPGVRSIDHRVEPHSRSERFPGLQGHRRHRPPRSALSLVGSWTPAFRLLVSVAGGIAALSATFLAAKDKIA